MEKLTFSISEAAQALGIARNSAYEAARLGVIPTIRIGKRLLVPRRALERLLDAPEAARKIDGSTRVGDEKTRGGA